MLFGTHHSEDVTTEHRPIRINYFAQHMFDVDGESRSHILVSGSWYKKTKIPLESLSQFGSVTFLSRLVSV